MTLEETFRSFGLSYHYLHLTEAISECGPLAGKRVFEIGGCLPSKIVLDEIGAAQWIGIDFPDYWEESGDLNPSPQIAVGRFPIEGFSLEEHAHACLEGDVTSLPASFDGQFDFVFSTSALEHVADLPGTLAAASRILRPGGKMFAVAMRLWPSSTDHHLPSIFHNGALFEYERFPIPPWAHIYMTPDELKASLDTWLPEDVVSQIIHLCYHSPQINRAFPDDYERALLSANFSGRTVVRIFETPPPEDILARLEARCGQQRFDQWGVRLVAVK